MRKNYLCTATLISKVRYNAFSSINQRKTRLGGRCAGKRSKFDHAHFCKKKNESDGKGLKIVNQFISNDVLLTYLIMLEIKTNK